MLSPKSSEEDLIPGEKTNLALSDMYSATQKGEFDKIGQNLRAITRGVFEDHKQHILEFFSVQCVELMTREAKKGKTSISIDSWAKDFDLIVYKELRLHLDEYVTAARLFDVEMKYSYKTSISPSPIITLSW